MNKLTQQELDQIREDAYAAYMNDEISAEEYRARISADQYRAEKKPVTRSSVRRNLRGPRRIERSAH